jgi:SAM-dependent methyltransferase
MEERLARHNKAQRDYFESTLKQTMIPAETPYVVRQTDEVLRCAGITPDDLVLEVGCGMGRHTLGIAERGVRIEGLDLSPVLLDRLREFDGGRHNIPLYATDIIEHPAELDERYDVIIGFFTLHHLHDLNACYTGMARMLKPGGRIVFLEPNAYNLLYYLQILITPRMTWAGDGGMMQMRRSVVFPAMTQAGLVNPTLERFGFFPPFVTNRPWGRKLESVLERFPLWKPLLPFQLFRAEKPPR